MCLRPADATVIGLSYSLPQTSHRAIASGSAPWTCDRNLDAVFLGCRFDAPPSGVSLGLADTLDLIESRDGIANVSRVRQRLLAFLGERKLRRRNLALRVRAERMLSALRFQAAATTRC